MGWEERKNGRYFYTKKRIGGRVVSVYEGAGLAGQFAAVLRDRESAQRQQTMTKIQHEYAQILKFDALCGSIVRECTALAKGMLVASGYHQHKGQWRQRRMTKQSKQQKQQSPDLPALPALPAPDDLSRDAFKALVKRCNSPEATSEDMQALQRFIPHYPNLAGLGDMLELALSSLASSSFFSGVSGLTKVGILAHYEKRRKELGYESASGLERPLIDSLILCEQRLGIAEQIAQRANEGTFQQMRFYDERLTVAQTRYLRAVETLARIRRVRVEVIASDGNRAAGMAVERPG